MPAPFITLSIPVIVSTFIGAFSERERKKAYNQVPCQFFGDIRVLRNGDGIVVDG